MKALYDHMWREAVARFTAHRFEIDPLIDGSADSRRGVSVIFRPEGAALEGLKAVQEELRQVAGEQYLPAPEALHVTGLTLISCTSNFCFDAFPAEEYAHVLQECLRPLPTFEMVFSGLTASPSCVMAQGFTPAGGLDRIRDSLHRGITRAGLPHTIGHRYAARTAHCTLLRFRQVPAEPERFVNHLRLLRDRPIGACRITHASLVFNDWYHRPSEVRELHVVELGTIDHGNRVIDSG